MKTTLLIIAYWTTFLSCFSQIDQEVQFKEKEVLWRNDDTLVFLEVTSKTEDHLDSILDFKKTTRYSMRIVDQDCRITAFGTWNTSNKVHGTFLIDDLQRLQDTAIVVVSKSEGYIDMSQEFTFDISLSPFDPDTVKIASINSPYPKANISWYYSWRETNPYSINYRPSPCVASESYIYAIPPISKIESETPIQLEITPSSGTVFHADGGNSSYPQDSLIYDQYVGEYIAGSHPAHGWRKDTINGGYNKEIYDNPFVESLHFTKEDHWPVAYRFDNGKLYSGPIEDTLLVRFTPNKVKGYLYGEPYYESVELEVIFRAKCVNGMVQGRGILIGQIKNLSIYKNILLAECNFEDGEIVGVSKYWDLNSIDFEVVDNQIYHREEVYDYKEFKALLNYSEISYEKGSSEWTTWMDYNNKGKKIKKRKNK